MANSQAYNDFYRDLDLIAGVDRPRPSKAKTIGCLFRIAEAVRQQEYDTLIALGMNAMDANLYSWVAFQGVIKISVNPHPTIYQTTEAKTITGKGES